MSEGRKITLGGREFNLLPCPAIGLKTIGRNFTELGSMSETGIDVLTDAIYYGIKREARDDATITREFVEWNIDATNVQALTEAVVAVNQAVEKGATPGEA